MRTRPGKWKVLSCRVVGLSVRSMLRGAPYAYALYEVDEALSTKSMVETRTRTVRGPAIYAYDHPHLWSVLLAIGALQSDVLAVADRFFDTKTATPRASKRVRR